MNNAQMQSFEVQITAAAGTNFTEPFPAPDKLCVMLLVENSSGSAGTVSVIPQHSNDGGRNWVDKASLTLSPSSTAAASSVTLIFAADDGTVPSMRLMRLKLSVTTITPNIRGYISTRTY